MWSKGLPKDVVYLQFCFLCLFVNGLLVAVQQAELGTESSDWGKVGGLLFAEDFVGVSESGEQLQRVIDVVHSYCRKWRLKANVSNSAVIAFGKGSVEGSWKWGEHDLPRVSKYTYLGIDFPDSGTWDMHMKKVVTSKRLTSCIVLFVEGTLI